MPHPPPVVVRLVVGMVAIVAIVGMHGSAAEAHSCGDPEGGPGPGATSHEHGHEHGHHGPDDPAEPAHQHCGAMACAAIVAPNAAPDPAPTSTSAALLPSGSGPLRQAPAAPEPPVPRQLLHA